MADAYEAKVGELIYGEVKKQTKDGFIIDLGDNAEAYLAREEMIPKEILRPKQRMNAILYNVNVKVVVRNYCCHVLNLKC